VAVTSRLSAIEVASALMRRSRKGAFGDAERARALASLDADLSAMLIVELTAEVVTLAQGLLERHGLCAGDAVQLASCLHLRGQLEDDVSLVAFGERLVAAARRERVAIV
jgi:predicted nucleic acid-binding protein